MQKRKKILLIDDFLPLLEEVSEFLAMEGFQTITANDGTEGVQKAIQYIPDLVICDIEMPNMNGYEVFKMLESIPATQGIPFIFVTARAQAHDFREGLKLGVDDYITKPFELDELILSINKRFEKMERIKSSSESKFSVLAENPLVGVFYYLDKRFTFLNEKLISIMGYSAFELSKVEPQDLVVGDAKKIINMICLCLKGIHETTHLKFTVYNKEKQLKFLELFARHINTDGKNGLIGSVVEVNEDHVEREGETFDNPETDIDEIMQYLISLDKDDIVQEIVNVKKLMHFETEANQSLVQESVKLTQREIEVLTLICNGYTNNEIADQLFISNRTVENHRANLLQKTGTKNTATLVAYAVSNKIVRI